jgi:hypothetical protein
MLTFREPLQHDGAHQLTGEPDPDPYPRLRSGRLLLGDQIVERSIQMRQGHINNKSRNGKLARRLPGGVPRGARRRCRP